MGPNHESEPPVQKPFSTWPNQLKRWMIQETARMARSSTNSQRTSKQQLWFHITSIFCGLWLGLVKWNQAMCPARQLLLMIRLFFQIYSLLQDTTCWQSFAIQKFCHHCSKWKIQNGETWAWAAHTARLVRNIHSYSIYKMPAGRFSKMPRPLEQLAIRCRRDSARKLTIEELLFMHLLLLPDGLLDKLRIIHHAPSAFLQRSSEMYCIHQFRPSIDEHVGRGRPSQSSLRPAEVLSQVRYCEHQTLLTSKTCVRVDAIIGIFRIRHTHQRNAGHLQVGILAMYRKSTSFCKESSK